MMMMMLLLKFGKGCWKMKKSSGNEAKAAVLTKVRGGAEHGMTHLSLSESSTSIKPKCLANDTGLHCEREQYSIYTHFS